MFKMIIDYSVKFVVNIVFVCFVFAVDVFTKQKLYAQHCVCFKRSKMCT